jgi:prepilin-type N-terminal cleavage/methylation domain
MNSLLVKPTQRGFGLVEFMIAMTLGLVLLLGLGYVFLGTRGAFRTTENLSRMQDNARYALDMIGRDIRMAGYVGCGNLATIKVNIIANPPVPAMTPASALVGYADGSSLPPGAPAYATGDVLTITSAGGDGTNLTGNLAPQNANIKIVSNPDNFAANDVLMVTDCSQADVFRATSVSNGGGNVTIAHANSTNTGNRVGTYNASAFVMRIDQYSYFIGTNASGGRSLYRTGLYATEELAANVHDMRFRYGLDTNGDGSVDSYSTAPGNWAQVVSVTVNLLVESPDTNIATAPQTLVYNNGTFTAATEAAADQRRAYQVYSATFGVRNRMPLL